MLNNNLKRIVKKIGMDKSIAYSSGSRIVQGVSGVVSVFFISTFLTGEEQGFYFTFGSIVGLQVFFELGLTGIMTQYVAYEASHLQLNDKSVYEGEQLYKSRLASLVTFCFKWYSILSGIVFLFLMITGYVYFNRYGNNYPEISWGIPWILICIGTIIKLFQSPFNSILTGLGKVKEMSKISFFQQLLIPLSSWIGLVCGLKLYVVGIGYLISVLIWQVYVWKTGLIKILLNLAKVKITEKVSYVKEIFPYQWKIALSWISGYFVYQLFNPVLFAIEGPTVAGQMGLTISALSAIQALAMSWQNTKIPMYSGLIARKEYNVLDTLFNQTVKQMIIICSFLLSVFYIFIWFLNTTHLRLGDSILAERFLGYLPTFLLMIAIFLNQFVNSWATYLRCHKQEPYLVYSICSGIACCLSTLILGNLYGLYGVTIGYCIITIVCVPWAYNIYKTKKKLWHSKYQKLY